MIRIRQLCLLASIAFAAGHLRAEEAIVPYAKAFQSDDTMVELVLFAAKHDNMQDALIKFTGPLAYNEGIDGQVQRYAAEKASGKVHYYSLKDGRRRLTLEPSSGDNDRYQARLDGKEFSLWRDDKRSKELKAADVYKAYRTK